MNMLNKRKKTVSKSLICWLKGFHVVDFYTGKCKKCGQTFRRVK